MYKNKDSYKNTHSGEWIFYFLFFFLVNDEFTIRPLMPSYRVKAFSFSYATVITNIAISMEKLVSSRFYIISIKCSIFSPFFPRIIFLF
jgi:hypothetical protein